MALAFQLRGDMTRRVIELIYNITGYDIAIWDEQGLILDSTEKMKVDMAEKDHFHQGNLLIKNENMMQSDLLQYEKKIYVDGKNIGKIAIRGAGQGGEVLPTLILECIAFLIQENRSYEELQHLVHEYETIFNFIPAQIWHKDTQNNVIRVNKQVEKDIGLPMNDFAGCRTKDLFPAYADQYYRDDLEVITSGKPKLGIVEPINRINGETRWMSTTKVPIFNINGSVSGLVALVLDITDSKKTEEQRAILAKIFENSGEAASVTDADNKFVAVNQAFTHATGYSFDEVVGKDPNILKSGYHDELFYQKMWADINQTGFWQGEIWEKRKDGTVYIKWLRIQQIKDEQGKLINYLATFSDITQRKANEERIAYLDRHDPLTGLPNRRTIVEELGIAMEKAKNDHSCIGVISMDLDRFKNINDSLGHEAGDEFLKEITRRLESCSTDKGITGRFGGDSFFIILPGIQSKTEIMTEMSKRIAEITKPVVHGHIELMVTASMGVCMFPDDGETAEVLMRNADTAMHKAKENGRNTYQFFTPSMNEYASDRLIMENDLRRAANRKEFMLLYQPQFDAQTEEVIGVEALIRWIHPIKQVVSPMEFIPLAEETGLIIPIGEWILIEACRQHQSWIEKGLPPIPMSVNISAVQFHDPHFLSMLAGVIKNSGIDPVYLDLEVTESVIMKDPEFVIEQLHSIKAMGIKLSLDDFGTGFSSLSYLQYFPLDRLKIDQSFIRGMINVPVTQAIIESIIALGKNLKIKTIAEGVEIKEELNFLQKLQCDEVQGYYYSRPLSSYDFIKWFKSRKAKKE